MITSNRSCLGAYVFDKKKEEVITFKSNATILASGGASKVYLYTSNPDGTSGDGMALAWRAGANYPIWNLISFTQLVFIIQKQNLFN